MPNAEIERLKLAAQIEILERNVADLELQLENSYSKIRMMQDKLHDCERKLARMESLYGTIDEESME